jgi:hypothetical protein
MKTLLKRISSGATHPILHIILLCQRAVPKLQICNPSLALALLFPLIFKSTVVGFLYLHFHEAPPTCAVAWDSWLFETFRAYSTAAFAASPNSLSVCSPRPDSLIYKGENVSTLKPPDITGSLGAY